MRSREKERETVSTLVVLIFFLLSVFWPLFVSTQQSDTTLRFAARTTTTLKSSEPHYGLPSDTDTAPVIEWVSQKTPIFGRHHQQG